MRRSRRVRAVDLSSATHRSKAGGHEFRPLANRRSAFRTGARRGRRIGGACYHQVFRPARPERAVHTRASPSSRGLGRGPFKAKTRVRIPLGTPHLLRFATRCCSSSRKSASCSARPVPRPLPRYFVALSRAANSRVAVTLRLSLQCFPPSRAHTIRLRRQCAVRPCKQQPSNVNVSAG